MTEVSQGLKGIAKELDVPVLALSQLSRAVEQREDKRPQLSDLRDSGSIEQDADMVLFLFREEYYHDRIEPDEQDGKYMDWRQKTERIRGIAELDAAKQRHGPTGRVQLHFNGPLTTFSNLQQRPLLGDRHDGA